jgi:hypothetical protein
LRKLSRQITSSPRSGTKSGCTTERITDFHHRMLLALPPIHQQLLLALPPLLLGSKAM